MLLKKKNLNQAYFLQSCHTRKCNPVSCWFFGRRFRRCRDGVSARAHGIRCIFCFCWFRGFPITTGDQRSSRWDFAPPNPSEIPRLDIALMIISSHHQTRTSRRPRECGCGYGLLDASFGLCVVHSCVLASLCPLASDRIPIRARSPLANQTRIRIQLHHTLTLTTLTITLARPGVKTSHPGTCKCIIQ